MHGMKNKRVFSMGLCLALLLSAFSGISLTETAG